MPLASKPQTVSSCAPTACSPASGGPARRATPGRPLSAARLVSAITPPALERAGSTPLYVQIARHLASAVEDGSLAAGSRLEGEVELARAFSVSRPTVRMAIDRLAEQGLLVRRRGAGTVVVPRQVRRPVELTSLFDDLVAQGRVPATTVLSLETVPAAEVVARCLGLAPGAPVLLLERLRHADGAPLGVMRNFLPPERVRLDAERLSARGLYEMLRDQGLEPRVAEQTIGARAATAAESRLLHAPRAATMLTLERTAYDAGGKPVEHGRHAYRADRYRFEMNLVSRLAGQARDHC